MNIIVAGIVAFLLTLYAYSPLSKIFKSSDIGKYIASSQAQVLGESTTEKDTITFAIDAVFSKPITVQDTALFENGATFYGPITASNIIYSLKSGNGIGIVGGQNPTISNTGVLSLAGQTGALSLVAGTGVTLDGLKITNSDTGSAQNIFKTISVSGQSNIVAGSNSDTLTFTSGQGIALLTNAGTKTFTINSDDPNIAAGWTHEGSIIRLTNSLDFVGVGTATPEAKLDVDGNIFPAITLSYDLGSSTREWNNVYLGANLDFGTNTITDGTLAGNWAFSSGNLSGIGTIGSGAITSTGAIQGTSLTDGTATLVGGGFTGLTGITSSGTITLSGLGVGVVQSGVGGELSNNLGTTNYLTKWNAAGITNAAIYEEGGNVGIGTTTPTVKLDILGVNTEAVLSATELITNAADRDFSSSTGNWSGTNWAIAGDVISHTSGINILTLSGGAFSPVVGLTYQISFDINTTTYGALDMYFGGQRFGGGAIIGYAMGNHTRTTIITATTTDPLTFNPVDLGWEGSIDNVSIKQLTPTSAIQALRNADGTIGLELRSGGANFLNSFVGVSAGYSNITGVRNTAFGNSALYSNTTGGRNVALGANSLRNNVSGSYNIAVGSGALYQNNNDSNIALGQSSLYYLSSGSNNVTMGERSGFVLDIGSDNVFLGALSGLTPNSIDRSILLGAGANPLNTNGDTNEIVIGYGATGLGSNSVILGNSSITTTALRGNVGIGTISPNVKLHIVGSSSIAAVEAGNLLTADGGFDTTSGWTEGTGWTIGSSGANHTAGQTQSLLGTSDATDTSMIYQINVSATVTTPGDGVRVSLGGADSGTTIINTGAYVFYIKPSNGSGTLSFSPLVTGSFEGTIDSITIYSLSTSLADSIIENSDGTATPLEIRAGGNNMANIFLGTSAGRYNLGGRNNSAMGVGSLSFNTTGNNNSAFGVSTLLNNSIGSENSAMGVEALLNNIGGERNSAFGAYALRNNSSGYDNSAMGAGALLSNLTGTANTAMGKDSLWSNTTGADNSAIGVGALANNTTGDGNTAIGKDSLMNNTTGSSNVAFGKEALYSLRPTSKAITGFADSSTSPGTKTTVTSDGHGLAPGTNILIKGTTNYNNYYYGITNVTLDTFDIATSFVSNDATGWWGVENEGLYNTALGHSAAYSLTTGSSNVFIGEAAGDALTIGRNNIIIGSNIDLPTVNTNNMLSIGNLIYGTGLDGSGTTISTGNVGIGTTSPNAKLDVLGTASVSGTLTLGDGTTNVIQSAYGPLSFNYKSDLDAWSTGLTLQDGTGNVGIGEVNPGYKLTVNGQPAANGYTAFTNYSDSRLKTNISSLGSGFLNKILSLVPSTFNYNSLTGYDQKTLDRTVTGFIAQDLQNIFPEMVGKTTINGIEYLDTNLSALPIFTIRAIQELNTKLDGVSASASSLIGQNELSFNTQDGQAQIDELKIKIAALEKQGAITSSPVEFQGTVMFRAFVEFFENVVFHKDVTFLGRVIFNKNMGGTATISQGSDHIDVAFSTPYGKPPVITTNLIIADRSDKTFIADGSDAFVSNVTENGFSIYLPQLAMRNYSYNWIAVEIDSPTDVKNTSELQKILEQVAGVSTASASLSPTPYIPQPTDTPQPTTYNTQPTAIPQPTTHNPSPTPTLAPPVAEPTPYVIVFPTIEVTPTPAASDSANLIQ